MHPEKLSRRTTGFVRQNGERAPAPGSDGRRERDASIDFIKGALVMSMVVYHSLNYTNDSSDFFRYLRFVTLGFICISGFVITRVLSRRYETSRGVLFARLLAKGVKLILLFTIVNVLVSVTFGGRGSGGLSGLRDFLGNTSSIYLTGNGTRAAFEVLLPIGYLMVVSPIVLSGLKAGWWIPCLLLAVLEAYNVISSAWGVPNANADFLAVGLCGMISGALPSKWLDSSYLVWKIRAILALAGYVALASVYNSTILINLFGTLSVLAVLWMVGHLISHSDLIVVQVDKLGRYSLFAYMMQIALLQLIVHLGHYHVAGFWLFAVIFVQVLVLTTVSVLLLDRLMRSSKPVRVVYGWIFG